MYNNDDPTFGALAAAQERIALLEQDGDHYRTTIADVCTERDDYRAKLNRAELRNDALRAQIATFEAPAKDPDSGREEVKWSWIDGATVVVDGDFERLRDGSWGVSIDAVYLRGIDISGLVDDDNVGSLRDAVEASLEAKRKDHIMEMAA